MSDHATAEKNFNTLSHDIYATEDIYFDIHVFRCDIHVFMHGISPNITVEQREQQKQD